MEALKNTLLQAFALGTSAKPFIDTILSSNDALAVSDLKADLIRFDLDRLRLLRNKLDCGDVIARAYHRVTPDGREQGCLHFWLEDVHSKHELMNRPFESEEMLKTVWRVVRFWDYGVLNAQTVRDVLDELISDAENNTSKDVAA